MELRPFSFVESEYVKKNVKLEAISKNTLQKYMHLLTKKVEQEIIKAMPEKIALIVDGWTSGSTHYLGVMASFCDMDQNVEVPLLAFSPLIDETSQSAAQQYVFLEMTLSQYGKSMEDNVVALIADNCETNDYRKSTLPMNLEEQLFLRFNKKHWDLNLVNQIVSASE